MKVSFLRSLHFMIVFLLCLNINYPSQAQDQPPGGQVDLPPNLETAIRGFAEAQNISIEIISVQKSSTQSFDEYCVILEPALYHAGFRSSSNYWVLADQSFIITHVPSNEEGFSAIGCSNEAQPVTSSDSIETCIYAENSVNPIFGTWRNDNGGTLASIGEDGTIIATSDGGETFRLIDNDTIEITYNQTVFVNQIIEVSADEMTLEIENSGNRYVLSRICANLINSQHQSLNLRGRSELELDGNGSEIDLSVELLQIDFRTNAIVFTPQNGAEIVKIDLPANQSDPRYGYLAIHPDELPTANYQTTPLEVQGNVDSMFFAVFTESGNYAMIQTNGSRISWYTVEYGQSVNLGQPEVTNPLETQTISGAVIFVSDQDGDEEINILFTNTLELQQLTDNTYDDFDPSVSSVLNKIVFLSNRDGDTDIYVMDMDGSNIIQLTNNSDMEDAPTWSPDGRLIAFRSRPDPQAKDSLWIMNADGSALREIVSPSYGEFDRIWFPSWSPDGSQIAYIARDINQSTRLIDPIGLLTTELSTECVPEGGPPAWSPDSKLIACISTDRLVVVSVEDGSLEEVYIPPTNVNLLYSQRISWSDDGGRLIFVQGQGQEADLYMIKPDGTNLVRLTNNLTWDGFPQWIPDSAVLAMRQTTESNHIDYFAIGDSVASGHGLADDGEACRRSNSAYPYFVANALRERYTLDDENFHHLACSGATATIPNAEILAESENKWIVNQIDYVIENLSDRPTIVSLTIGANDFEWSNGGNFLNKLYNVGDQEYIAWADETAEIVELTLRGQIPRLLEHDNVTLIISDYHSPFNHDSIYFKFGVDNNCLFRECQTRLEYGSERLNAVYLDIWNSFESIFENQLQIASVRTVFVGHEAPQPTCGGEPPDIENTWVQHAYDSRSNSDPFNDPLTFVVIEGVREWSGDCIHPNELGARAYAEAVYAAIRRLGW